MVIYSAPRLYNIGIYIFASTAHINAPTHQYLIIHVSNKPETIVGSFHLAMNELLRWFKQDRYMSGVFLQSLRAGVVASDASIKLALPPRESAFGSITL